MGRYEADHILFGAAYYDEYLMMKGIDRIDEDMAMMKDAGLNVIRIAESTWSTCEPQPGVFDFTYVDRALDAAQRAVFVEHGDVGDATQIEQDATAAVGHRCAVERRSQWRTLATRGDIATAKISNGGDAGEHVLIGLQCRRIWKCCYERALMGMVLP